MLKFERNEICTSYKVAPIALFQEKVVVVGIFTEEFAGEESVGGVRLTLFAVIKVHTCDHALEPAVF